MEYPLNIFMAVIDPKAVIGISLAFPIIYIWQKWEFNILFLAVIAFWAWKTFDEQFVHKSELEKKEVPPIGPAQPLMASEMGWDIGPDGVPRPKPQPTHQQYKQGGG